jgi:hydrogenase maturation protease
MPPAYKEKLGELLVIGYGNELRSDDGAGPKVVETVASWNLPGVRTLIRHQLTPELAPEICAASQVVFVDAATDCSSFQSRAIQCEAAGEVMTHAVDPRSLLQMASLLYERCPPALWLTIPARNFEFGDNLSPLCAEGMRVALKKIRELAPSRN